MCLDEVSRNEQWRTPDSYTAPWYAVETKRSLVCRSGTMRAIVWSVWAGHGAMDQCSDRAATAVRSNVR